MSGDRFILVFRGNVNRDGLYGQMANYNRCRTNLRHLGCPRTIDPDLRAVKAKTTSVISTDPDSGPIRDFGIQIQILTFGSGVKRLRSLVTPSKTIAVFSVQRASKVC
jgi:hypothetical protein